MAILGSIGKGTAVNGSGVKKGLFYYGATGVPVADARVKRPALLSFRTGGTLNSWVYPSNPYMLAPDRGYRDFILKTKVGGSVVPGAKVTLYLRGSNTQVADTKTTDANGYVKFANLSMASVYYVVANHPTDTAYNAARFDWLTPLQEV